MPEIGEIKHGREIGFKHDGKRIWIACADCGKERWVALIKREPAYKICRSCDGKKRIGTNGFQQIGDKSHKWKGGRTETEEGYILIVLPPDNFFYPMARANGYVFEHRLVIAQSLGRCLQPNEVVHHKNGIKDDNHEGNLELTTQTHHLTGHYKGYQDGYQKGYRDGLLRATLEIELLKGKEK